MNARSSMRYGVVGIVLGLTVIFLGINLLVADQRTVIGTYPVAARVTAGAADLDLGVTVDTDRLDFGSVSSSALRSERELFISNRESYPVRIRIDAAGNITPYLSVSETRFRLPPNSQRNLTATFNVSGTPEGYYAGVITVQQRPTR